MQFTDLKPGDQVTRNLAGVNMMMIVREIKDGLIVCDALDETDHSRVICYGAWTFDPATGAEVDDDLSWGPRYGKSGSFLKRDDHER